MTASEWAINGPAGTLKRFRRTSAHWNSIQYLKSQSFTWAMPTSNRADIARPPVSITSSDFDRSRGYAYVALVHWREGRLDEAEQAAKTAIKYKKQAVAALFL